MKSDKYQDLYNQMEDGIAYTATDLGVAGATMTAMVRRNLVNKIAGKPAKYVKFIPDDLRGEEKNDQIAAILDAYPANSQFKVFGAKMPSTGIVATFVKGTTRNFHDYLQPINTRLVDAIETPDGKKIQLK